MDAQGWTLILGAIFAGLPAIATFIIQLRTNRNIKAQNVEMAVQGEKLDNIKDAANGVQDKLVAVTARASYQEGVAAQKAESDGKQRRATDKE